ncbi:MAG: valine--tRNA ligase [Planctomycetota bacterium]|nr:MAG: valine--tRNA ligase [Planctomycetota bacterium]
MTATQPTLPSRFAPGEIEQPIYRRWLDSGLMTPPAEPSGRPTFTIMIPPPNVTGVLHMGHALNNTMQDIVARQRRMAGHEVLWLPGTDHAGIATQAVVEKKLFQEQGLTREDLGRDAFLAEVWRWKEHHGNTILEQLKRLGCSCDWTRTRFTLDPDLSRAVREAFVRLWRRGLVYRGARLVNWDCKLQTAVSDDEIEYVERAGKLWYLRYPVRGQEGRFVTVATTRPETMLGDTGVAVHPADERYRDLVGATLILPIVERPIPVVADETVEAGFGTGAVKVTPGHDPADYERGARHGLPVINLLEPDGTLNENAGPFAGLSREQAREAVVAWFEERGLLEKIEDIRHNVTLSDRSKTPIEPLVSEQWFVRMEPMAGPAIEAVRSGALRIQPERWTKVYLDWLENVRDWCISRQLWWGHRIPVWYDEDGVPVASVEDLEIGSPHPETGKPIVRQDDDVLDTWASSWLWPFATLGWPEETSDLARFYPTQFLSTARDIIYLWVARMVMAGYEFMDSRPPEERCPFAVCYIHANVLDAKGKRMSKSAGNGIDPVDMIEKYGADAVRYSLMILTREGQDVKLAENRFELGQRFCNKIWNAARFVLGHLGDEIADQPADRLEDRWIRSRLAAAAAAASDGLEGYHFHDAAQALYRFVWDEFCDWYVEGAKLRLRAGAEAEAGGLAAVEAARVRRTLGETLSALLRLLHPFTPFLTEALWAHLPPVFQAGSDLIMGAPWPREAGRRDEQAEADFRLVQDAVRGFRNVRALLDLGAGQRPTGYVQIDPGLADAERALADRSELLVHLADLGAVEVGAAGDELPSSCGVDQFAAGSVFLPLPAGADRSALAASLEKKRGRVAKGIAGLEKKLGNPRFLANADPEVVESERARLADLRREAAILDRNLGFLGGA